MFTTTNQASTLSTATVPAQPTSPTSPTRPRLRGLSYLRNYTQNLHARSESENHSRSRPAFPRARSHPPPGTPEQTTLSPTNSESSAAPQAERRAPSPPNNTTNGWIPSTTGGPTRIRQQSASDGTPSSGPAPTVTTAETTPARAMTRNRADTAGAVLTVRNQSGPRESGGESISGGLGNSQLPSIRFIPHFDPRASRPSLSFPAVTRTLPTETSIIRVGRYSERENTPDIPPNTPSSAPVGFKSKVVSRRHCEFWSQGGQWFVKDVKSSSGTFLNHLRLSPPGVESKAYPVNDGDVVQLGIDFRGGEEMIFRCVKIRIECNRGWQKGLNNFNKKTHKQLLNRAKPATAKDSDTASVNTSECSICLMSIAPCQSLFVAPCSHVWHYKCIRPILNGHTWPNFLCPNCRAVADLEADIDEEEQEEWEVEATEAAAASKRDTIMAPAATAGAGSSALSAALGTSATSSALAATIGVNATTSSTGGGNLEPAGEEPDGLRTPRAMQPVRDEEHARNADAPEDDLADLAHALSLAETTTRHSEENDRTEDLTQIGSTPQQSSTSSHAESSSSSLSVPRNIPGRSGSGERRYEVSPGPLGSETIMTPRNDAGPFVLDGGAGERGRDTTSRSGQQSLDAAVE